MTDRYKGREGRRLVHDSYDRLLKQWGINVEESDVETRFGRTHILCAGSVEKPPLMLFHGVGDNSALMWIYNAGALSEKFRIIAVDALGGSGKSEPAVDYYKNFDQCLWIDDLMRRLELEKMKVAGVSYGSYLAQYLAVERPERVEKAVCMAGSISWDGIKSSGMRNMLVFLPEALFPSEKNARKLMNKLCGSNPAAFTQNKELMGHWLYLLKYFRNTSMMYHKIKKFSSIQIDGIREKTLFLIGDRDRVAYHPESLRALDENHLNYKIIKDAGHGINHEQAGRINDELLNFFAE